MNGRLTAALERALEAVHLGYVEASASTPRRSGCPEAIGADGYAA
jgi:hypothetical protein